MCIYAQANANRKRQKYLGTSFAPDSEFHYVVAARPPCIEQPGQISLPSPPNGITP